MPGLYLCRRWREEDEELYQRQYSRRGKQGIRSLSHNIAFPTFHLSSDWATPLRYSTRPWILQLGHLDRITVIENSPFHVFVV